MSIFNKTSVNGWQPQQLTIKDVKFATWIAFLPGFSLSTISSFLAHYCRKSVSILAGMR